jgi:FlaA1/EpsC-like NDP-sugar epimerase
MDLAKAINEKCKIKIIGIRPGEKLHEEMIYTYDSKYTVDLGRYYAILPNHLVKIYKKKNFKLVDKNFNYNSETNKDFLNIKDLKKIIQKLSEKNWIENLI